MTLIESQLTSFKRFSGECFLDEEKADTTQSTTPLSDDSNSTNDAIALEIQEVKAHEEELFGLKTTSTPAEQYYVLVTQSIPVIISFFLGIGGTFINLVFAGQYTHESGNKSAVFAGVSLANMFANVSCMSILIGMSSAVETLGSQYNGAENYRQVGIVLQRAVLILAVLCFPIGVLWYFVNDIFAALGVEPVVCEVIERFIRIRCLTIPMDVINESFEKYLMSIGVMRPSMWANISFNVFLLLFNLLFVLVLQLHYDCLAWSWVLSLYLSASLQILLSLPYPEVKRTLVAPDPQALRGWWEFIKLGLPGTIMLCSEWWAYEVKDKVPESVLPLQLTLQFTR